MFLKNLNQFSRQSGASLVIVLFIIVAIALLSAALVRLNSQSNASNAHQVISTRAFFAAESGANFQAMRIFPLSGAALCSNVTYNFTASGLNACVASTTCSVSVINGEDYYQITSEGQCNIGQAFQATRRIEVRLQAPN
ncbi:MAG: PilX N-terminal domain-containing pilus assembly protein [Kangiellaceae bacterium]